MMHDITGRSPREDSPARRQPVDEPAVVRIGNLVVKEDGYEVITRGQVVRLTTAEFRLLWRLAVARGQIVSADQLSAVGAGMGTPVLRSVKSRIYALRCKLGPCRAQLATVRGGGYRLLAQEPYNDEED